MRAATACADSIPWKLPAGQKEAKGQDVEEAEALVGEGCHGAADAVPYEHARGQIGRDSKGAQQRWALYHPPPAKDSNYKQGC